MTCSASTNTGVKPGDDDARTWEWSEKAIGLDPQFRDAYSMLGWTYFFDGTIKSPLELIIVA